MFTCLPIIAFLISQPQQQIPRDVFEHLFMFFGEKLSPFTRFPGAEGGRALGVDGCFKGVKDHMPVGLKRDMGKEVI